MFHVKFDLELREKYKKSYLIGIDEAGRGPLAGPVVACAYLIKNYNNPILTEIKDSKKLSPLKREKLFNYLINKEDFLFSFGYATNNEIDQYNILNATFLAMKRALRRLLRYVSNTNDILIAIDGNKTLDEFSSIQQICVVKGDMKSAVIGCASIIAKVLRDRWMNYYHNIYPSYDFKKHKGYPTKAHVEIIENIGYSPIHRKTFKLCKKV